MSSSLQSYIETLRSTDALPLEFELELPDVKKAVKAYLWKSSAKLSKTIHLCIYTHGAGGTCMSTASVNLCQGMVEVANGVPEDRESLLVLGFDGAMHLGSRTKTFVALIRWAAESDSIKTISLAGRSMGCRAAALATAQCLEIPKLSQRLVLQSYPLAGAGKGTKDEERKQVLLALPKTSTILFQIGDNDEMCSIADLQELQQSMDQHCSIVTVEQVDHGLQLTSGVAPRGTKAEAEQEIGRALGRIAGEWLLNEKPESLGDGTLAVKFHEERPANTWSGFGKPEVKTKIEKRSQHTANDPTQSKRKAVADDADSSSRSTRVRRTRRSQR
ncbi:hypothetical protein P389DRAFT_105448 [Cystobasidium minutum MCA 4210]|uniref:uncharacterized protein n=1 Tax=Cystobasidium minutum MCA 4210 TaxID=1397322 RepID=UPI0034CF9658|eukprot:jgi/Rhomi1/105448/CE105447_150